MFGIHYLAIALWNGINIYRHTDHAYNSFIYHSILHAFRSRYSKLDYFGQIFFLWILITSLQNDRKLCSSLGNFKFFFLRSLSLLSKTKIGKDYKSAFSYISDIHKNPMEWDIQFKIVYNICQLLFRIFEKRHTEPLYAIQAHTYTVTHPYM